MKRIQIKMPDDSVWEVPANVVASHRADYYCKQGGQTLADAEYRYTLKNNCELLDWAAHNMTWKNVVHVAKCVKPPPSLNDVAFQEGWVNGPKEVIE